jgi:hypothetical protein
MSHGDIKLREVVIHYSRLRVHTNTYLRTCTGAVHVLSVSQSYSTTFISENPRSGVWNHAEDTWTTNSTRYSYL